jgi:hypothetical protein
LRITEDDLDWPTHRPAVDRTPFSGPLRNDPAGASLDRINHQKGYVPGNVRVISLRANLLRKDITHEELRALADFFFACSTFGYLGLRDSPTRVPSC